jgi:photosystem II stability/assembly factor-like uncharacterized protein
MRYLKLSIIIILFALSSSACTLSIGKDAITGSSDGGVWLSADKGRTWKQASAIPSISGKAQSLGGLDVNVMSADPQDSKAVYVGTVGYGLYYTYNVSQGWTEVKSLGKGTINDVKVDPKSKCILYVAISNQVQRSADCGRTWQQVYFDNNPGVSVTSIAIDHYNSDNVYIGTSRGEIIKSIDHGFSWRTIKRADEGIVRLVISPQDSRLIFVATNKNNIYSFSSNTNTNVDNNVEIENNFAVDNWINLGDVLKDFNLGQNFRDIAISASDGTLLLASSQVLMRSPDQGITWEKINLLPTEKDAIINAIAIGPKNSKEIYYVTNTAFFASLDGGISWSSKELNTSRAGNELLIDLNNPEIIYLGTKKIN